MVRIKQRYLLVNILYPPTHSTSSINSLTTNLISSHRPTPAHVTAGNFVAHLRNHIAHLFGDFGLGVCLSSLKVVYLSNATSTLILRVPRNHHRLVWAALSHVTELPAQKRGGVGLPCVVRVVRVSGTIRKAEEELIRRAKRDVVRARMAQDGRELPVRASLAEDANDVEVIEDPSGEDDEEDDDSG